MLQITSPPPITISYPHNDLGMPNRTGGVLSASTLSIPRQIGMAGVDFWLETRSSIVHGLMHGLLCWTAWT